MKRVEFFNIGKKIVLSLLVIIPVMYIINYQYQLTKAGELDGMAQGQNRKINYSLEKESRGKWLIDINFSSVGSQQSYIEETLVVFFAPIAHEVLTRSAGSNENYRYEGHHLTNTQNLSQVEITEVLSHSYVNIKWKDEEEESVEEKYT